MKPRRSSEAAGGGRDGRVSIKVIQSSNFSLDKSTNVNRWLFWARTAMWRSLQWSLPCDYLKLRHLFRDWMCISTYLRFHRRGVAIRAVRSSATPFKTVFTAFLRPDVFTVWHAPLPTCSTRVIYSERPPYLQSSITRPAMQTPVANERISVKHPDLRLQFMSSRIPRECQAVVFTKNRQDIQRFV